MMYLEKLILVNFQSHKYSEFNFAPGLNVIVGESDRGKTAVIRALRWLFYNEPKGSEFIRVGEKEARVTAYFSNGLIVSRERSDRKNRYVLIKPGEAPVVFEKFGQDVPPEISEVLGVQKIRLDKDWEVALNLSTQLEPPFLLFESATRKAKAIGQFQGVHLLDYAAKNVSRDIRNIDEEIRYKNTEIAALKEKLEEFSDLPHLFARLNNLKTRKFIAKSVVERLNNLTTLRESLEQVRLKIHENKDIVKKLGVVSVEKFGKIEALYKRYQELLKLKESYTGILQKKREALEILNHTLTLPRAKEYLEEALDTYFKLKTLQQLAEKRQKISEQKRKLLYIIGILTPVEVTVRKYQEILPDYKKQQELLGKYQELQKLGRHKTYYAGIIYKYRKIPELAQTLKNLEEKLKRYEQLTVLLHNLSGIDRRKKEQERELESIKQEVVKLQNQYREVLLQAGRCPTCNTPLDEETVQKIIFGEVVQ
ncbi:AAA family ATPase [Carboxydothermus islandicus]|nr:AAA family ATPase [Carboxydothermus islandicus]